MKNHISYNGEIITPSKVVCVGRNYHEHIVELNNETPTEPVIFVKPNSALSAELFVPENEVIHYEAELAFLVKQGQLMAVGLGLDLTKRLLQNKLKAKGLPWERAKAFNQSAVMSEFVSIPDSIHALHLELYINGELKQKGGCSMMINSPNDLFSEVNSFMSLEDGDVLMTGTPAGVGQVQQGGHFMGKVYSNDQLLIEAHWTVNN